MAGEEKFSKLLEPYHIGQVKTKNRMIKTASTLGYQYDEKDGHITPRSRRKKGRSRLSKQIGLCLSFHFNQTTNCSIL